MPVDVAFEEGLLELFKECHLNLACKRCGHSTLKLDGFDSTHRRRLKCGNAECKATCALHSIYQDMLNIDAVSVDPFPLPARKRATNQADLSFALPPAI